MMILFILAIMLITGFVLVTTSIQSTSTWLTGSFIGSILLIIGFMYYFAKSGGLPYEMEIIFFLHSDIHRFFQYSTVTIDEISRILSIGRAMFLFFSAGFVIRVSTMLPTTFVRTAYWIAFLFALSNYLIYEPIIYERLTSQAADEVHALIALIVRIINVIFVTSLLYLLLRQLKRMKTPWLRTKFMVVFITILNLDIIFLIFGIFSPLQVGHVFRSNYSFLGPLYYSSTYSLVQWYVLIAVSFILTIGGTMSLWRYNKVMKQMSKPEMLLEKKIRENNMVVRIFTHGLKNQILAQRILIRKIKQQISELVISEPFHNQSIVLSQQLEQLEHSNSQVLKRMDELYNAFKTNRMQLKPVQLKNIYDDVLEKLEEDQRSILVTKEFENYTILADRPYLVQMICNLLSNAFDAVHELKGSSRLPSVSFDTYHTDKMVVLQIKDNGIGIEKGQQSKIFEPFYSRKNSNTNWGLGLSYVQQTVKAHFGYVRFESKLGEGTTFYVYLPIYNSSTR